MIRLRLSGAVGCEETVKALHTPPQPQHPTCSHQSRLHEEARGNAEWEARAGLCAGPWRDQARSPCLPSRRSAFRERERGCLCDAKSMTLGTTERLRWNDAEGTHVNSHDGVWPEIRVLENKLRSQHEQQALLTTALPLQHPMSLHDQQFSAVYTNHYGWGVSVWHAIDHL